MFTCPEDDIHSIYADGELPKNYVAEYEAHVNSCPKCSAKLKKFLALNSVFAEDKESFHFSKDDFDSSFQRLEARLSYKKVTQAGKNTFKFPKPSSGIKYFAAGIAAAAVFAFVVPSAKKANPFEGQVSAFQPVARTSISSTANQVSSDGNIDVSVLNSILASDNSDKNFYTLPVSSTSVSAVPVLIIGGSNFKKIALIPSLKNYDVFCPQNENSENQNRNNGFAFHVSYPFSNLNSGK